LIGLDWYARRNRGRRVGDASGRNDRRPSS
jgi:hypothetical protein